MPIKLKITKKLKEMSAMTGGAVQGHAGREELDEMFSSRGLSGRNRRPSVSGEKEHAGHVERSRHQGLRNVMEADDDTLEFTMPMADSSRSGETPSETMKRMQPDVFAEAESHGYELLKILGAGEYGTVFLVEDIETGGEYVLKAVGLGNSAKTIPERAINRELSNYETISNAASQDEELWKHFPETYETWRAEVEGKKVGFIIMEALVPLTDEESAFIPDFNDAVADAFPMDAAQVSDYSPEGRDQSVKAKQFMKNGFQQMAREINMTIEDIISPITLGSNPEVDAIAAKMHPRTLKNLERLQSMEPEKLEDILFEEDDEMEINTGYDMQNYVSILKGDIELSYEPKANGSEYLLVILLKLMNGLVELGDIVLPSKIKEKSDKVEAEIQELKKEIESTKANAHSMGLSSQDTSSLLEFFNASIERLENSKPNLPYLVEQELKKKVKSSIQSIATSFINGIRRVKTSPVGFKPEDLEQTPEEREASGQVAGQIFKVAQKLYKATGLVAKDMHYKNVMKREGSGDIVIVDLGLFRPASPRRNIKESRNYRLKVLTSHKK